MDRNYRKKRLGRYIGGFYDNGAIIGKMLKNVHKKSGELIPAVLILSNK